MSEMTPEEELKLLNLLPCCDDPWPSVDDNGQPYCTACDADLVPARAYLDVSEKLEIADTILKRLEECDWVITLPDRMDAVRKIAREGRARIKGDIARDYIDLAEKLEMAAEGIKRLASPEAFWTARVASKEETMRMQFAAELYANIKGDSRTPEKDEDDNPETEETLP